jgi:hypothetical protein
MSKITASPLLFRGLILISLTLNLTACGSLGEVGMLPGPVFASSFPPDGPPNYQQGMVDGCKTASGATGGAFINLIYDEVYYDVNKAINDRIYYTAWKDGFDYCKYDLDSTPLG